MNIDHLKCFVLVAENLSFARAAEALYISQPAVTKQINALEQELGVSLFLRSTRHVELTPAGMSFYQDAKEIINKTEQAINRLQRQNIASCSLWIGLSNPTALFSIAPILAQFHRLVPQCTPELEVLNYKIILNLFLEKKLDLLFYYKENILPKANLKFQELIKDHFVCLASAQHPFAAKEHVTFAELTDQVLIACNPLYAPRSTALFQEKLLKTHPIEQILYCNSIEISHCLVAAGMGLTILPSILCLQVPEFCTISLEDTTPLSFGVFYHKRHNNAAVEQFLSCLHTSF